MILPAMGIISEVIPVFSRKPIFGYKVDRLLDDRDRLPRAARLGAPHVQRRAAELSQRLLLLSSMSIAVPTGVKIFNWIATMWRGRLSFDTPMLFALGFIALFTIGGLSGIILAAFPVDWQVTDTYYVVAHIHYVLFGGAVFGVVRRRSTTGGRRSSGGCSTSAWARLSSGSCSSASTSRSSRCTCSG